MKSVSMGSFQYKNQANGEILAYLWVILLYFNPVESSLIPAVLELGQVRLFWKFDSCHIAVKLEFESISQAV